MKTLFAGILLFFLSGLVYGQGGTIEGRFEKNKGNYKREHFSVGEDASSGVDYLFYRSRRKIVKIRSIWSATHNPELRIEDFYFNGSLALYREYAAQRKNLRRFTRGLTAPLVLKEEMYFENSKLVKWKREGKEILPSDPDWAEAEKGALERARGELEMYRELKQ